MNDENIVGVTEDPTTEQINEEVTEVLLEDPQETTEESEESITLTKEQFDQLLERSSSDGITYYGYTDHTLYLSADVDGATLNDLYSMMLSTRNIILLFFLFFIVFKLGNMLKSVLYRVYNR